MMNDSSERMEDINELRRSGFIVEMDDFGSGYSSLNLLKDISVDVLKIDMKFLSKSKDSTKARTIVQNIIKLSKELAITPLIEGVETDYQLSVLMDMGCELFQGYYFSMPIPVDEYKEKYTK
jgi:EAL domain-containing protein (putative c-di-GMP-specific phosphodiesterase class I)